MIKRRVVIRRLGVILSVLLKYGFAEVIHRLRAGARLPFRVRRPKRERMRENIEKPFAVRLRLVCEELGPTFIKFGQMLSMRPDILPQNVVLELEKLQDRVPPFPAAEAVAIVAAHTGRPFTEVFRSFTEEPEAAASIAQVHRAVLVSGEEVAVKIRRPGIRELVAVDLEILHHLAQLAERHLGELALLNPSGMVREFSGNLQRELDFFKEGRNIESFRKNFANDATVRIPRVFWEYTDECVLTMEFMRGTRMQEILRTRPAGHDRKLIARRGVDFFFRQIFEFGFFHADPHAGNVFILPGDVIAPLDFGMVGFVGEDLRERLGRALVAFVNRDARGLVKVLRDLDLVEDRHADRDLAFDLEHLVNYYHNIPLARLNLGTVILELIDLIRRHRIHVPVDLVLLGKAVATIEALGKQLDPELDIGGAAAPYVSRLMLSAADPLRQVRKLSRFLADSGDLARSLPDDLAAILKKIRKDRLVVKFEHSGLEPYIRDVDKTGNRLAASVIIAGFLVGSSLITSVDKGPAVFGVPVIGFVGYCLAGLLGLWVIIGIIRSGRL